MAATTTRRHRTQLVYAASTLAAAGSNRLWVIHDSRHRLNNLCKTGPRFDQFCDLGLDTGLDEAGTMPKRRR